MPIQLEEDNDLLKIVNGEQKCSPFLVYINSFWYIYRNSLNNKE